ncbi:hypothetical protein [Pseudanabaena mucicola]|uniref:Uncharacterized protein n=1 Tax=Pseudanabaena mucicola FACHB-723 TaxID=2692860 RepID=A0ABR7ZRR4_9CYAN|nr:hypothetical protein [Pseudanabaena mucicola]MBD2186626.1 hypothetical protein [Pseudanabaena mucicola FACHB-723]
MATFNYSALAQQEPETNVPRAIRLSLINGIIELAKNPQQAKAKIELIWDVLPEGTILPKQSRNEFVKPIVIRIPNRDLGDPKIWTNNLSSEEKNILLKALYPDDSSRISDLSQFRNDTSSKNFEKYWLAEDLAENLINGKDVDASNFFSLFRDHKILTNVLKSQGIEYFLTLKQEEEVIQEGFPKVSDQNIIWEISIYQFPVGSTPSDSGGSPVPTKFYYRYTIKAKIEPIDITIAKPKGREINAEVAIRFKNGGALGLSQSGGAEFLYKDIDKITLTPTKAYEKELSKIQEEKAGNQLDQTLNFIGIGGQQIGDLLSRTLFEGDTNYSIISGGLFGRDKVELLVGANLELAKWEPLTLGVLFGVVPQAQTSLYIGPSLQASIFTLSGGARISDNNVGSTRVDTAGVISIDLSRLIGLTPQTKPIQLAQDNAGGGWGNVSDELTKNLAVSRFSLKMGESIKSQDIPNEFGFQLQKVKECSGADTTNKTIVDVRIGQFREQGKSDFSVNPLQFFPQGIYRFEPNSNAQGLEFIDPSTDEDISRNEIKFCSVPKLTALQLRALVIERLPSVRFSLAIDESIKEPTTKLEELKFEFQQIKDCEKKDVREKNVRVGINIKDFKLEQSKSVVELLQFFPKGIYKIQDTSGIELKLANSESTEQNELNMCSLTNTPTIQKLSLKKSK